jgi:hypothetical protein
MDFGEKVLSIEIYKNVEDKIIAKADIKGVPEEIRTPYYTVPNTDDGKELVLRTVCTDIIDYVTDNHIDI